MPLGMELGLSPGDFVLVRWEPSLLPQFPAHVYCGQTAGWIKMSLGMEVGLSPSDFVLGGDPAPLPKKGAENPPHFPANFYCAQTDRCITMPLQVQV